MKPTIVLLHGANGSGAAMRPLAELFAPRFDARTPDLPGHGGRPIPEHLSIADIAADVIAYLDAEGIATCYLFGYSSGGTVALYLARHFPKRFRAVCTLAAKFVFDAETVSRWTYLADPKRMGRPGSQRPQEMTEAHHPQDWMAVTRANQRLFAAFGQRPPLSEEDLRAIAIPALFFCSDKDQIVSADETVRLGELVPGSRVVFFRGQCHPLRIVPTVPMTTGICDWIDEVERRTAPSSPVS